MNHAHPLTLFEKIWQQHAILEEDGTTLLHVGRHLVHEGSRNAFQSLRQRGLNVRRPDRTFATPDHYVSTTTRDVVLITDPIRREVVAALQTNAIEQGVHLFELQDPRQGIVHVVGPEQGVSLPGLIIVCGDSHTATHGALGALAFGIGSSEVAHVLATQTLWQTKPRTMRITVTGTLSYNVYAKDLILAIIARIGAAGAVGHVIEYAGTAITALSIEARMTLCNMSIEAGGRAGMIAPDEKTFAYLKGRPFAPTGTQWPVALEQWRSLRTDDGAHFDSEVEIDASQVEPMMTWGTSPQDAIDVSGCVPDPDAQHDEGKRVAMQQALDYMGLTAGTRMTEIAVDRVFIGSCTNSRIEDLRIVASIVSGHHVRVPTLIVPGSTLVKQQAEAESLHHTFVAAGIEWRESGCSMCVGMNGDIAQPGERCASTTNRNFVGRQGKGVRTHLVSPATAAATAITGRLTDARTLA